LITPSTKELMDLSQSKYAVVVAVAKEARKLSEKRKNDENYRLSSMVTEALEEILAGKIVVVCK